MLRHLRALFLSLLLAVPAAAQDGLHFTLNPPLPTTVGSDKVELIEFFNFSCPACFRFQGPFNQWKRGLKPENVELLRKPVVFERAGGLYARLYFALEAVGQQEKMFQRTFDAIHRERRLLNSESRMLDWLEEEGLDRDQMESVFNSFAVQSRVARAARENDAYGVSSTPQMVVAGKYRLTPADFGSYPELLSHMTGLIESEGGRFAAAEGATESGN